MVSIEKGPLHPLSSKLALAFLISKIAFMAILAFTLTLEGRATKEDLCDKLPANCMMRYDVLFTYVQQTKENPHLFYKFMSTFHFLH